MVELTIGIITMGRYNSIRGCLARIHENVLFPHQIIVVDGAITDDNRRLYQQYANLTVQTPEKPLGPAAARRYLAGFVRTPYLLYLDDDIEIRPRTASIMLDYLKRHSDVDIAGGIWWESDSLEKRAAAHMFHFGMRGEQPVVIKNFISVAHLQRYGITSLRADMAMSTIMVATRIFETVQFDDRYDFYFDMFDFFIQAHRVGLATHILPAAQFDHRPIAYSIPTYQQTSNPEVDRQRFKEKWGVEAVGPISLQVYMKQFFPRPLPLHRRIIKRLRRLVLRR